MHLLYIAVNVGRRRGRKVRSYASGLCQVKVVAVFQHIHHRATLYNSTYRSLCRNTFLTPAKSVAPRTPTQMRAQRGRERIAKADSQGDKKFRYLFIQPLSSFSSIASDITPLGTKNILQACWHYPWPGILSLYWVTANNLQPYLDTSSFPHFSSNFELSRGWLQKPQFTLK